MQRLDRNWIPALPARWAAALILAAAAAAQPSPPRYFFGKLDLATAKGPASVVSGDWNGDGLLDLALANPDSSNYSVILGDPDGGFAPRVDYPLNSSPQRILTGDFNGDGMPDLAIAVTGSILVLLGNGSGTFASPVAFGSVTTLGPLTADFNGDGKLDLALPEACTPAVGRCTDTQGRVQILLGNGDGTFAKGDFAATIAAPVAAAVADFNGDGKLDLAAGSQSNGVSVLLGNGDGTFQPRKDFAGALNGLVAADFNGDGIADLALGGIDRRISVYAGKGDGTFQNPVPYETNIVGLLTFIAAADLNGDGRMDLIACGNQGISVLLSNDAGGFDTRSDYYAPGYAWAMAAGDFNGDTVTDLAVVNRTTSNSNGPDSVSVMLNLGTGKFAGRVDTATGKDPRSLAAAKLGAGTNADLVVANYADKTAAVLVGDGSGAFAKLASIDLGDNPTSVTPFSPKFSAPPKPAAKTAENSEAKTDFKMALAGGIFQPIQLKFEGEVRGVTTHLTDALFKPIGKLFGLEPDDPDYNGDGNNDFAFTVPAAQDLIVVLCNGDGTCKNGVSYPAGQQPVAVAHGDFNSDGKTDLVVADAAANRILIFLNKGDGTFQAPAGFATGARPVWLAVADFDGDGKDDVATANAVDNSVSLLRGSGNATFAQRVDYAVGLAPYSIIADDFNGDGIVDLAVSNSGANTISVLPGAGDGTFRFRQTLVSGAGLREVVSIDLDGSGRPSLVSANSIEGTVSAFPNPPLR